MDTPTTRQFSFYFHTRQLSEKTSTMTNPFTQEPIEVPVDEGLTDSEREAFFAALGKHGFEGPEPNEEGYALYLPKQQSIRIRGQGGELATAKLISEISVELSVTKLTDEIMDMLLDIATASNLALMDGIGDQVRLVDNATDEQALARWPDAKPVRSAKELRNWLEETH